MYFIIGHPLDFLSMSLILSELEWVLFSLLFMDISPHACYIFLIEGCQYASLLLD